MTSGSSLDGVVVDGDAVPLSGGGSRRPPVLPPSRPSLLVPEVDGLGLPLLDSRPPTESPPVTGALWRGST